MFLYPIMWHSEPKIIFIHARRYQQRKNRWIIAAVLHGKLNMLNFPCKTMQDYPARLHASYCAILQRVRYLARCCMQDVARYLARKIASCRQALKYMQLKSEVDIGLKWLNV